MNTTPIVEAVFSSGCHRIRGVGSVIVEAGCSMPVLIKKQRSLHALRSVDNNHHCTPRAIGFLERSIRPPHSSDMPPRVYAGIFNHCRVHTTQPLLTLKLSPVLGERAGISSFVIFLSRGSHRLGYDVFRILVPYR